MRTPRIMGLTVPVAAAAVGIAVSARAEECLSDWGAAGEIVRREKLMTVQQLIQTNAAGMTGQVFRTTLCKDGDDYIYKVVVRLLNGQLRTVVVDARPSRLDAPAAVKNGDDPQDDRRFERAAPGAADDPVYPGDERGFGRGRAIEAGADGFVREGRRPGPGSPPPGGAGRFDTPERGGASAFGPGKRTGDR